MNAEPLLQVEGLTKRFDDIAAVDRVSFSLRAGELLALIGPNGAGKSTCFNMLMGQLEPDSGSVRIAGMDVTGRPARTIWRRGVGRTFQITQTFSSMTVLENVQMALISGAREHYRWWPPANRRHRGEALALLQTVGMEDQAEKACGLLAYGDLKRVELAVALAGEPRLLLMDEPTAGMAPAERAELMMLIAAIAREKTVGVLFTEHDMDVVFDHAERIMVMDRGRLIAVGSPGEVRSDEKVRKVYLGYAADGAGRA
ncbi:MAG: ABC transporter ATP-binding protein [Geminicoccaceae bacterium]